MLVVTSLLGAYITWSFRVDTTGLSLHDLDRIDDGPTAAEPTPARTDLASVTRLGRGGLI